MSLAAQHRMVLVHAHPDDETIGSGVTMMRTLADGGHVTLLTCTLGEEGEVLVPDLAHLAAAEQDKLGEHRVSEMDAAMKILGVTDHRWLGGAGRYRDSGMMGLPTNDNPGSFWQADLDEAADFVVEVLRQVRPQVLVTYNSNGGYGHPDHIQAHRVAWRGVELAADPSHRPDLGEPWDVAKVYELAFPRSAMERGFQAMKDAGENFFGVESVEDLGMLDEDDVVTTVVSEPAMEPTKMRALAAHATQVELGGPFFRMSEVVGPEAFGTEFYRLAKGESAGPRDDDGRETDLFAGL